MLSTTRASRLPSPDGCRPRPSHCPQPRWFAACSLSLAIIVPARRPSGSTRCFGARRNASAPCWSERRSSAPSCATGTTSERDLLFVIGSRIAREVELHEEAWAFEGYRGVPVDPEALIYYRYERIVEDVGEISRSVFDDPGTSEASRLAEVRLLEALLAPDALEAVERV